MNNILSTTCPAAQLELFCRRYGIRSLAVFGSLLHGNAHAGSDLDLLVDYAPNQKISLFAVAQMEIELSVLFGQTVDLRTAEDLSPYFRESVLAEAQVLYES